MIRELVPSPHLTLTDDTPDPSRAGRCGGLSEYETRMRRAAPARRGRLNLRLTRGANVSTNTVATFVLVTPAGLTAVTCHRWRPWLSAAGTGRLVAFVSATCTPSTLTL